LVIHVIYTMAVALGYEQVSRRAGERMTWVTLGWY
jgi:hypothetical protein